MLTRKIDNDPDNVWISVTMKREYLSVAEFYKCQGTYVTHNPSSLEEAISRVKNQVFKRIVVAQTPYYMKTPDKVIRNDINKYLEFKEV